MHAINSSRLNRGRISAGNTKGDAMPSNLRIFVSSTCNDLFQERRDLAQAFLDAGHSVILSELPTRFAVNPNLSCVENCLDVIRHHADLIVLIVSSRYGSTDTTGKSITQQEYEEARRLGIPIYTFVRRSIHDLMPIYRANPATTFKPVVEDNRVLEFIKIIETKTSGNWLFPFFEVSEIIATVLFQISSHLRSYLDTARTENTGELFYTYTNNYTVLLSASGLCHRSLEYEIVNHGVRPVTRIFGEDRSDMELSMPEVALNVRDSAGQEILWELTLNTPNHKIWDYVLSEPLPPGGRIRFASTFFSADCNSMETGHIRRAGHGFIKYLFLPGTFKRVTRVATRNDDTGWIENPAGVSVVEDVRSSFLLYHYREIVGRWRFRVEWE